MGREDGGREGEQSWRTKILGAGARTVFSCSFEAILCYRGPLGRMRPSAGRRPALEASAVFSTAISILPAFYCDHYRHEYASYSQSALLLRHSYHRCSGLRALNIVKLLPAEHLERPTPVFHHTHAENLTKQPWFGCCGNSHFFRFTCNNHNYYSQQQYYY